MSPLADLFFGCLQVLQKMEWFCVHWMRAQFTAGYPRSLRGRQEAFCSGPWGKSRAQSSCCLVYEALQELRAVGQNSSCQGAD